MESILAMTNGSSDPAAIIGLGLLIFELLLIILVVAGLWKVFTKAGRPGWASIVPFYNVYVLCEIAGKPGWWLLLYLIPCVNIVIAFIVMIGVSNKFGQGVGFALGLIFLPIIFYPLLGFGDFEYQG